MNDHDDTESSSSTPHQVKDERTPPTVPPPPLDEDGDVSIVSSFEDDDAQFTKTSESLSPLKLKKNSSLRRENRRHHATTTGSSSALNARSSRKNRGHPLMRQLSSPGCISYDSMLNGSPSRSGASSSFSPSLAAPQALRPPTIMTDDEPSSPSAPLERTPQASITPLPVDVPASAPPKVLHDLTRANGTLPPDSRAQLSATLAEWRKSLAIDDQIANISAGRRASASQVRDKSSTAKTLAKLGPPMVAANKSKSPSKPAASATPAPVGAATRPPAKPRAETVNVEPASLGPFSLWEYLKEEVLATDFDSTQEMKWERVTNFVAVPWWVEKIIIFGFVVCLDSFLYTFTILPLRFLVAVTLGVRNLFSNLTSSSPKRFLHSSHKCDILKMALVVLSCFILSRITDASKMYHSVRGQDVVKLYVIFNVMEIFDRLCCSLGQDLLDALFSRMTLGRRNDGSQPVARPFGFFLLALFYIQAHTLVLFYQLVTLNVAINSYDNALLTLLLSNQFVEIKGSVFKKFEKENLFQLTCADIVERFQLTLILTAIGLRNLIEVSGGGTNGNGSGSSPGEVPLPRSFTVFPSISLLETSFAPVAIVLASECLVDWLKHAFITKFNHIRPSVYGRFMDVLCRDLVVAGPAAPSSEAASAGGGTKRRHTFVDQSPIVSRRLGFAALPLACLLVRISAQIWGMLADDSHYDECAAPSMSNSGGGARSGSGSVLGFLMSLAHQLIGGLGVSEDPPRWMDGLVDKAVQTLAWSLTALGVWVSLVVIKLILGSMLVSFASYRYRTMLAREKEEELNARDRPAIGVGSGEREYEAKVREMVRDDGGEASAGGGGKKLGGGGGSSLMDIRRYDMVKSRLW